MGKYLGKKVSITAQAEPESPKTPSGGTACDLQKGKLKEMFEKNLDPKQNSTERKIERK